MADISNRKHSSQESAPKNSETTNVVDDLDLSCGIGRFRTRFLGRKFANLYVFTIIHGIASFFSHLIGEAMHMQLISMERQFNIKTSQAGMFTTASMAGHLATSLWIGHVAQRFNIPFMLGISTFIEGLLMCIPAFIQFAHPYTLKAVISVENDKQHVNNLCQTNEFFNYTGNNSSATTQQTYFGAGNTTEVERIEKLGNDFINTKLTYIILVVIIAVKSFLQAFHSGALVSIYMDNNSLDKSKLGIFFGIHAAIIVISKMAGESLNSFMTTVPVDLSDTHMSKKDVRFVSAWWLCFLIYGLGISFFSLFIIVFPKRLQSEKQQEEALKRAKDVFSGTGGSPSKEEAETENRNSLTETRNGQTFMDNLAIAVVESERRSSIASSIGVDSTAITELHDPSSPFPVTYSRRPSLKPELLNKPKTNIQLLKLAVTKTSSLPVKLAVAEKINEDIDTKSIDTASKEQEKTSRPMNDARDSRKISLIKEIKHQIKVMIPAFLRLLKIPVFFVFLVDTLITSVPMHGIGFLSRKYTSVEYNVPLDTVGYAGAISSGVTGFGALFVSSYAATKVKTKMGYVWIWLITHGISVCFHPLFLLLGCDNVPVYGAPGEIGIPVNGSSDCGCDESHKLLSCGSDGNNYLSPCFAGCTSMDKQDGIYSNCSLLSGSNAGGELSPGVLCETDCYTNFLIYIIAHGTKMFVVYTASIPKHLFMLRLANPEDRALGLGFFHFFQSLMALPAPNIFGHIVDGACLIEKGSHCIYYDRDIMRYIVCGVHFCSSILMQISVTVVAVLTKRETKPWKPPDL